jgi:hypothetical protein
VVSEDGRTATRTDGSAPDYGAVLGERGFVHGVHSWELQLEGENFGVWMGVSTKSLPLGQDTSPNNIRESRARIWSLRNSGEVFSNVGGPVRHSTGHDLDARRRVRFVLDCDEKTLEISCRSRSDGEGEWTVVHTFREVDPQGQELFAFCYFDYQTSAKIVRTTSSHGEGTDAQARRLERGPLCVEPAATPALVAVLCRYGRVAELGDAGAKVQRWLVSALLWILQHNIAAMVALRTPLEESCAAQLQQLLSSLVSIDLQRLPHCSDICSAAATLYRYAQKLLLRSPNQRTEAMQDLASKLISARDRVAQQSVADVAMQQEEGRQLVLEPLEPEGDAAATGGSIEMAASGAQHQLTPLVFSEGDECLELWPGLVREIGEASDDQTAEAKSAIVMSSGRHYMEVSLASHSAPSSKSNAQGHIATILGLVRPSRQISREVTELNSTEEDMRLYRPLQGLAVDTTQSGEPVGLPWVGEMWWKSPNSVLRGDRIGVLLDCEAGKLVAVKNGKVIGTIFTELSGDFCFTVGVGPRTALEVFYVSAAAGDRLDLSILQRTDGMKVDNVDILERLTTAVVAEITSPLALEALIDDGSLHAFSSCIALFGHLVKSKVALQRLRPPTLSTLLVRAMQLLTAKASNTDSNATKFSLSLSTLILELIEETVAFLQEQSVSGGDFTSEPGKAFRVLESSKCEDLMSSVIALCGAIVKRRTDDGRSCAAALVPVPPIDNTSANLNCNTFNCLTDTVSCTLLCYAGATLTPGFSVTGGGEDPRPTAGSVRPCPGHCV